MRIGSFHVGSAFTDLLTSGVLNRVLISDLGLWATPVAMLSALRYLLAPLGVWAGYRSDTHPILGLRRLPYIWMGRVPMVVSLALLPVVAVLLAADHASVIGWTLATAAFAVYGAGALVSGGVYMALVRDSAPPARRGMALGIVQVFLLGSFPIAGIAYGHMMPSYDPALFWRVVLAGMLVATAFFVLSVWGQEAARPASPAADPRTEPAVPFRVLLAQMWGDRHARLFFLFLALGAASASAQDAVLEPFGGDVLGMAVGATTRFNAYWGVGVLVGMAATIAANRRRRAHEQGGTTIAGLLVTATALALLSGVSLASARTALVPVLVLFGLGYGVYAAGALSMLMAMTSDRRAGAYLGLWSVAQLVFRGVGIFLGGVGRDVALLLSGSAPVAYASVFALEAVGLLACVPLLLRADVPGFVREQQAGQP